MQPVPPVHVSPPDEEKGRVRSNKWGNSRNYESPNLTEQIWLCGGVGEIVVHNARPTQVRPGRIDEDTRRVHEVGVAGDIGLLVQPRHDRLQEPLQLRLGVRIFVVESKLRDPDRTTLRDGPRLIDKVLEVRCASVFVGVPVDVDKIDCAAGTVAHEPRQVCQAKGRPGIGDCRCSQQCSASKGLHVLLVRVY